VDVITGFPGETEADFQETYQFLQELEVSYFHVFSYSERPGTDAMTAGEAVPMSVRKQRNKMLRILSAKKQHAFYQSQLGTVRKVIFESEVKDGWIYGHTDNYVKTGIPGNSDLINQLMDIELSSLTEEGIVTGKSTIESII
jgi:threonylcarbamoyladenosine tRNA methylthiotransferase MtaB